MFSFPRKLLPELPVVVLKVRDFLFVSEMYKKGAVQKEMGSPNYFKFTRELKSAKI